MKITAEYLRKMGGCEEYQVEVFEEEWPDGARPLLKNLMRCVELDLDLEWFAIECLTTPAREEYKKATAPAWREYKKAIASAREEYKKAITPAWEEYKKATAPAWEECRKAIAPALYNILKRGKKVLR